MFPMIMLTMSFMREPEPIGPNLKEAFPINSS